MDRPPGALASARSLVRWTPDIGAYCVPELGQIWQDRDPDTWRICAQNGHLQSHVLGTGKQGGEPLVRTVAGRVSAPVLAREDLSSVGYPATKMPDSLS